MPISVDDLNGMYDPTQKGPGPKIVPPKKEAFDLDNLGKLSQTPGYAGGARSTDVEDYGKYLDQGVYSDQDIESQRGQHQSVLNKIGHALGNLPLNIVGDVVEGIGDLGLLAGQWGDDRTYTNALIEAGKSMHNVTGDIYMRNSHETLGATLSDPSWWIDQVEGAAEFGVSYAALGAGIGGTISKVTEAGVNALRLGKIGAQAGRMMGQLGTAGFMSYTMGAQNAGEVFKRTYDYQFNKAINEGTDPETAKTNATHIAAQSAATTAQLTTAIGSVLALGSMGAYFRKSSDAALDILKKQMPLIPGETAEQWGARIKGLDPDAYASMLVPSKSITHKLMEMGKMGVEMQQLQFGEKTGEKLGKDGKIKGFVDQFGELENYFDRTMDKDGALAFAVGAGAGFGTDFMRERVIPSRWADKIDKTTGEPIYKEDEEGNPTTVQRRLYTPKALSEMHSVAKFNQLRDAIAFDIDQFDKGQKAYMASMKAGDQVAAGVERDRLFNQHNVSTIINGTGDVWRKTYEEIANLSNEEAVQRGYSTGVGDTAYQESANRAASDLERYQKMYDRLQNRYGTLYEQNQGYKPVIDGIFSRQVHLDSWERGLQDHLEKLDRLTKEEEKDLRELYPGNPLIGMDAENVRKLYSATHTLRTLDKEYKELGTAIDKGDTAGMAAYVREYMGVDKSGSMDIVKAAKQVHEGIKWSFDHSKVDIEKAKAAIRPPEEYTFNDYVNEILNDIPSAEYDRQITLSEHKLSQAKRNLAEVTKEKNLVHMASKYNKYMEAEVARQEALEKTYDKEMSNRAKNQEVYDRKTEQQRDAVAKRYEQAYAKHEAEYNDEIKQRGRMQQELDKLVSEKRDWLRRQSLKSQISHLDRVIQGRKRLMDDYKEKQLRYTNPKTGSTEGRVDVDTSAVTAAAPSGTSRSPIVDPIDPQYDAVSHQVEDINPGSQKMEELEEEFKKSQEPVVNEQEERQNTLLSAVSQHYNKGGEDRALEKISAAVDSATPINWESFGQDIKDGLITEEQAKDIAAKANDYINNMDHDNVQNYEYDAQAPGPNLEPNIETIDIDPAEDIEILNQDATNAMSYTVPSDDGQGGITFGGAKTVDANTIANSTLGYYEFAPDHNKEVNLISQKDQINQKTNPDVLLPGKLMPGSNIRFEVDTEYDGPKNIVGQLKQDEYGNVPQGHETFQDYVDKNGNIPADKMGNVPIKIVDTSNGKTIGYVRKHEWVTERYGKDSGLRNIAERFDDEGNEVNGPAQSKRILDIRKAIVDKYNANRVPVQGRTTTKGVGHPILNIEVRNRTSRERAEAKPGFAFNKKDGGLLPDPKLEIVISDNGTLMAGKGYPTTKKIAGDQQVRHGQVMILIPGANGEHIATPLVGKNLADGDIPHRTISRAIELYLSYTGDRESPNTKEINKLKELTGIDVSNERGLRQFINQYFTHTQRFDDTAMMPEGQQSQGKFLFNVWDKIEGKEGKAWIKAGITGSGDRPVLASLGPDGKLAQEFSEVLKQGLATRTKAVSFTREGIRGINERRDPDRPFTDVHYRSDGRWQPTHYADYNEYVKAFSKTTIYGKNKVGDNYIYTANPSIAYEIDGMEHPTIEPNTKISNIEVPEPPDTKGYDESLANELDEIFNAMPNTERPVVKEIGTGPEKSKPLDMKNLEDLYTFTPEAQRNGKVPADVLRELQDRGHTFLPDGYNPFSLCL
jgi:hypothetical protein